MTKKTATEPPDSVPTPEPRGHSTSVSGANYVVHIPKPAGGRTFCGREASRVNCTGNSVDTERLCEDGDDAGCRNCVKAYRGTP